MPSQHESSDAAFVPSFALFSGGHDSLVSTHVAMANGYAQEVLHIDTGTGIPETQEFVRETCRREDWPLNIVTPPVAYDEIVVEHGFPGPAGHPLMYRRLKERCLASFARERKTRRGAGALVYCTGVRRQESSRRMRTVAAEWQVEPKLGWTWRAPILDFTKARVNDYIAIHSLRRNPVVDLLHMSGECLCGCFAQSGELDEIRQWFPDTAARIERLEARVRAAGHHGCVWGHRPPNVNREQLSMLDIGPLCSSCEAAA